LGRIGVREGPPPAQTRMLRKAGLECNCEASGSVMRLMAWMCAAFGVWRRETMGSNQSD